MTRQTCMSARTQKVFGQTEDKKHIFGVYAVQTEVYTGSNTFEVHHHRRQS